MVSRAYKFKYFFDAGSGTCIWAADGPTTEKYGYAVNHNDLPISQTLKQKLDGLIELYDSSINWENPAVGNIWSPEQEQLFDNKSHEALALLRQELGSIGEVIDK